MRSFFMFLVLCTAIACGNTDIPETTMPMDDAIYLESDIPNEFPSDISTDLGQVILLDGHMEGQFSSQNVNGRATILNGFSDAERTRFDIIIEPEESGQVVMAYNAFNGDITKLPTLNSESRGCSGPRVFAWDVDEFAVNQEINVEVNEGITTVFFSLDFYDGEHLDGWYSFVINDDWNG